LKPTQTVIAQEARALGHRQERIERTATSRRKVAVEFRLEIDLRSLSKSL